MTDLETELRNSMRQVDQAHLSAPGLDDRVQAGLRHQRRVRRASAAIAGVAVVAAGVAGAAFTTSAQNDKPGTALDPAATSPETSRSCEGLRIRSTGVVARGGQGGTQRIALGVDNGPDGPACRLDGDVSVTLNLGSFNITARTQTAPVDLAAGGTALIEVDWKNWCAVDDAGVFVAAGDQDADTTLELQPSVPPCDTANAEDMSFEILSIGPTDVDNTATSSTDEFDLTQEQMRSYQDPTKDFPRNTDEPTDPMQAL